MASFLRIDGEEFPLRGGRLVWYPAYADDERGLAFQLAGHGSRNLLHAAAWAPGAGPHDLSGAEVTVTGSGPEAAVDGRLFSVLLIRFGRVSPTRAIVSIDGHIHGLHADSDARAQVAADVSCDVIAADFPAYCNRCGRSLEGEEVSFAEFLGGRRVTTRRPRATCQACAAARQALEPPRRCSTCGDQYDPSDMEWLSDERTLAYTCTCPQGHTVAGTQTFAA
jgi:hypothetical protein